jgi:hypothetical protein
MKNKIKIHCHRNITKHRLSSLHKIQMAFKTLILAETRTVENKIADQLTKFYKIQSIIKC